MEEMGVTVTNGGYRDQLPQLMEAIKNGSYRDQFPQLMEAGIPVTGGSRYISHSFKAEIEVQNISQSQSFCN